MKAVAYRDAGSLERKDAMSDVELDMPTATGRDLLVQVEAISVNPADYKIRRSTSADADQWRVLGWDACGHVVAVGDAVEAFKPGDAVFYAGSILRPGTNSGYHLVDERIVGHKPATLSHSEVAALPLTAITAWEMLFDRLDIRREVPGGAPSILIVGSAGGVGSIAIQLVRALTDLTVIATASREETRRWVSALGAQHVIDHHQPLAAQVERLDIGMPSYVFSTTGSDGHVHEIARLIAPPGPIRTHRRSSATGRHRLQTQVGLHPLGVHVHPAYLRNARYAPARQVARRAGHACR